MSLALAVAAALPAQTPDRVLGVVTAVEPEKKQLALRADEGPVYGAMLAEGAAVLRLEPGERDLRKAEKVDFAAIAPGDRLLVRGEVRAENRTVIARTLVLMSRNALAARESKEREAWRTQSVAGVVTKVDAAARLVFLQTRASAGSKEWTLAVAPEVPLMRYADGSAKYADAAPSSLEAIRPGDQLRVRGPRDEAQSTIQAEAIVFGSFRTVAGEIKAVDAEKHEVTVLDLQTRKPILIRVGPEATLRKMPGPAPGGRPGGGPRPGMTPDLQRMLERLPAATFADLQKGDAIILSVARQQAITLIAGVDALLRATPAALGQMVAGWSLDMGMPQ